MTTIISTRWKQPAEPKFIILEGVDRSGKDSIQDAIDSQTRYKHMIMDRGPIGFKAYCEIFDKKKDLYQSYSQMEERMAMDAGNTLVIYLTADTEELVKRCVATNHEILDFDHHKAIYEKYLSKSPLPSITVDTTGKTADEVVARLVEKGVI